jgi:hypothetical protein
MKMRAEYHPFEMEAICQQINLWKIPTRDDLEIAKQAVMTSAGGDPTKKEKKEEKE